MKAFVSGKAVTVTPPDGRGEPFLYVELSISCSICGERTFHLAGHHLRPIVEMLQEFIAETPPELTVEGTVERVLTREWDSTFDPENN